MKIVPAELKSQEEKEKVCKLAVVEEGGSIYVAIVEGNGHIACRGRLFLITPDGVFRRISNVEGFPTEEKEGKVKVIL